MPSGCRNNSVTIWDEGPPDGDLGPTSMACNGAAGPRPTAATSTRSPRWSELKTNPDSRRRIIVSSRERERALQNGADALSTRSSSFRRRRQAPASSTSAAPTSSSACRPASQVTPAHRSPAQQCGLKGQRIHFGPATATSGSATSSRSICNSPAHPSTHRPAFSIAQTGVSLTTHTGIFGDCGVSKSRWRQGSVAV